MGLAVCVGLGVYASERFGAATGREVALEFLAGYVVEKSLAVDNIFVFVLVFRYFAVPLACQHRVLFYGILGALVFRAAFIAIGAALMQFEVVMLLFGALPAADRRAHAVVAGAARRAGAQPAGAAAAPRAADHAHASTARGSWSGATAACRPRRCWSRWSSSR